MTGRRPGRPAGTEINDDEPMRKIADLLLAKPEMKLAPVLRLVRTSGQYVGSSARAIEERFRAKWKRRGNIEMLEARKRSQHIASSGAAVSSGNGYRQSPSSAVLLAAMGLPNHLSAVSMAARALPRDPFAEAQRAMDSLKPHLDLQRFNDQRRVVEMALMANPLSNVLRQVEEAQRVIDQITKMDKYFRWPYC
jgi:hypothetical protein